MTESKFRDELAEWLYSLNHNVENEVGDSSEGNGWAAKVEFGHIGFIVSESTDGSVDYSVHPLHELSLAWEEAEQTYGLSHEPEEGDYVIESPSSGRYRVTPLRQDFHDYDACLRAVLEHMLESQFYPNVWLLNDHGNFLQLDMAEEEARLSGE